MLLKFLYTLLGADIILAILKIEQSGFDGAWLQILSVIFVAVAIIIRERE